MKMKKLLIAILAVVAFTSCECNLYGSHGTVEKVEIVDGAVMDGVKYRYKVTVAHHGFPGGYHLYTNSGNYRVGDTVTIK